MEGSDIRRAFHACNTLRTSSAMHGLMLA